jgi:DNA-binding NarL/FixJ family response regulator
MKHNLTKMSDEVTLRMPTLVIALPDLLYSEMISEWNFNCEFRTLAVFEDGENIVSKILKLKPDFLLIDSELPYFKGFDLAEKLSSLNLNIKIIIYASKRTPQYLQKYLENTTRIIYGFIHKGCGVDELEKCFSEVFAGKKYLSSCICNYLKDTDSLDIMSNVVNWEKLALLAKREKDVWQLMTQGKTEREIGNLLFIGVATVKTYKKRIKEKFDFRGKGKLTYLALSKSGY